MAEPFPEKPTAVFEVQQKCFAVGDRILSLEEKPMIAVYAQRQRFEIVDWGINLAFGEQNKIAREMVRKFLTLFSKAERDSLTGEENAEWVKISQSVNYRKFCAERAPFRYVEGEFVRTAADGFVVTWHDGSSNVVSRTAAPELGLLNDGERFSAMARFGDENKVVALESVSILPSIPDAKEMWETWPVRRS